MAIGTLPWCSFVGDQQLTRDYVALVTKPAWNIDVRPVQLEGRLLVVIEFRRTPIAVRMAFTAGNIVTGGFELALMDVFMAALALARGGSQVHRDNAALGFLLVTTLALYRRVAAR